MDFSENGIFSGSGGSGISDRWQDGGFFYGEKRSETNGFSEGDVESSGPYDGDGRGCRMCRVCCRAGTGSIHRANSADVDRSGNTAVGRRGVPERMVVDSVTFSDCCVAACVAAAGVVHHVHVGRITGSGHHLWRGFTA